MKRIATLTALFATTIILGLAGSALALDVAYDGYNDGVSLVLDRDTGIVQGYLTGAVQGDVMGVIGGVHSQGETITVTYTDGTFYEGLFTIIRGDGTWSHYYHDGVQVLELNSGTWVEGAPVVAHGENFTSSLDVVDVDYAASVNTKPRPGTEAVSVNTKPRPGTEAVSVKPRPGTRAVSVTTKERPGVEAVSVNTKPRPGTNIVVGPQHDHAASVNTKPRPGTEAVSVNTKPRPGTEAVSVKPRPGTRAVSVTTKERPGVESLSIKERPGVK